MTKTFATNSQSDIYVGNDGNLVVVSGIDAVKFACETATYAILKEMIFAQNQGIPYFETIWVGTPNYQIYRQSLIDTLLSIGGVQNVLALSLVVLQGVLSYTAEIETIYGPLELNNG